jgi:putative ABC transport system substrate-binding protein
LLEWDFDTGLTIRGCGFRALPALLFVAGTLAGPATEGADTHRIGFLRAAAPPDSYIEAFRQGLAEMGYVEGKNIVLTSSGAGNESIAFLHSRRTSCAAGRRHRDRWHAAVLAAKSATRTIPIIMAGSVIRSARCVTSMTRPGGNVTGMTIMASELGRKRLELLREVLPSVTRLR